MDVSKRVFFAVLVAGLAMTAACGDDSRNPVICNKGDVVCDGNVIKTCDDNGEAWVRMPCAEGQICQFIGDVPMCSSEPCISGCNGSILHVCGQRDRDCAADGLLCNPNAAGGPSCTSPRPSKPTSCQAYNGIALLDGDLRCVGNIVVSCDVPDDAVEPPEAGTVDCARLSLECSEDFGYATCVNPAPAGCTAENVATLCQSKMGAIAYCNDETPSRCAWRCNGDAYYVNGTGADAGKCVCDASVHRAAGTGADAGKCVCDVSNGYAADPSDPSKCICGGRFVDGEGSDAGKCVCDAGAHFVPDTDNPGQCVCDAAAHYVTDPNDDDKCRCGKGYVAGSGDATGTCVCDLDAHFVADSDHVGDCICDAGNHYVADDKGNCVCGAGYAPGTGDDAGKCVCDAAAHFVTDPNDATKCTCEAGFVPGEGKDAGKCVCDPELHLVEGTGDDAGKCVCANGYTGEGGVCTLDAGFCTGGASGDLSRCGQDDPSGVWSWRCSSETADVGTCVKACQDHVHFFLNDAGECQMRSGFCNDAFPCDDAGDVNWKWECGELVNDIGTCSRVCKDEYYSWSEADGQCTDSRECVTDDNVEGGDNPTCAKLLARTDSRARRICSEEFRCIYQCASPYTYVSHDKVCKLSEHTCVAETASLAEDLSFCGNASSLPRVEGWECADADENGLGVCRGVCTEDSKTHWIWDTNTAGDALDTGRCLCDPDTEYLDGKQVCQAMCSQTTCTDAVVQFCNLDETDKNRYRHVSEYACGEVQNGHFECLNKSGSASLTDAEKTDPAAWCVLRCDKDFEPDGNGGCKVSQSTTWVVLDPGPQTTNSSGTSIYTECAATKDKKGKVISCDCTGNYFSSIGFNDNGCKILNTTSAPISISSNVASTHVLNMGYMQFNAIGQKLDGVGSFTMEQYNGIKYIDLKLTDKTDTPMKNYTKISVSFLLNAQTFQHRHVGFALINNKGTANEKLLGAKQMDLQSCTDSLLTCNQPIEAVFAYSTETAYDPTLRIFLYYTGTDTNIKTTEGAQVYFHPISVKIGK